MKNKNVQSGREDRSFKSGMFCHPIMKHGIIGSGIKGGITQSGMKERIGRTGVKTWSVQKQKTESSDREREKSGIFQLGMDRKIFQVSR